MNEITFLTLRDTGMETWKASAAIDNEYEVYVPYFLFCDNEKQAFFMAAFDGTALAMFDGHPFFPVSWVMRKFLKSSEQKQEMIGIRDSVLKRNDEVPL